MTILRKRNELIRKRYELDSEIGRGASGSVWIARDCHLRRRIAIKLLQADCEPNSWRERFESEAWTIAQLRSPHIVQVFDAGVDEGDPFIVMELLEGESLEQRLTRRRRFSLRYASSVLADVAKGLTVIHQAGVVHRDLKPANVFIARENEREICKLLDFGIATSLTRSESEPASDSPAGTPCYMSPEQFEGGRSQAADDIWAMAVLAYQLVTGHVPFEADSIWQLRQRVAAGVFRPASSAREDLPKALDALFERAFSRDPARRYSSCLQLASDFARVSDDDDLHGTRILVLDDEPDMELLVRTRFQREVKERNYELSFARDGAAGLAALREHPDLDVVLTDINMPGMDGLTFLARVPEINPFVRVIVVTAYSDMANIRTAMNRGAFDFVCKPIDFADLKHTVLKSAEHVRTLRRAFASRRENVFMKLLVDASSADKLLRSLAVAERPEVEQLEGSVACMEVRELASVLANGNASDGLAYLNSLYEIVLPEVNALGGRVIRLADDALVAVFSGVDHLRRAAEACVSICEELTSRLRFAQSERAGALAIGLETGTLAIGPVGSLAFERLGQAVVGAAVLCACELGRSARSNTILASSEVQHALKDEYLFDVGASDQPATQYRLLRRVSSWPTASAATLELANQTLPLATKS